MCITLLQVASAIVKNDLIPSYHVQCSFSSLKMYTFYLLTHTQKVN